MRLTTFYYINNYYITDQVRYIALQFHVRNGRWSVTAAAAAYLLTTPVIVLSCWSSN